MKSSKDENGKKNKGEKFLLLVNPPLKVINEDLKVEYFLLYVTAAPTLANGPSRNRKHSRE